jgi:hypothetical protein
MSVRFAESCVLFTVTNDGQPKMSAEISAETSHPSMTMYTTPRARRQECRWPAITFVNDTNLQAKAISPSSGQHSQRPERKALSTQLEALDIERVNRIYHKAVSAEKDASDPNIKTLIHRTAARRRI